MRRLEMMSAYKILSILLALGLVLAACSQGEGDEGAVFFEDSAGLAGGGEAPDVTEAAASPDTTAPGSDPAAAEEGAAGEDDRLGAAGLTPAALQTTQFGRDIIFTADLSVAVTDVAEAGQEATRIVEQHGGFLFGQQTSGSPEPRSILTFKIAPESFQQVLADLGAIGELRNQTVSANDVTERIVDLESRISTATVSVQRLRTLLEQAGAIEDIVELENELLERETELESLRGQLRTLQDQVAMATVVLTLTETASRPVLAVEVSAYPGHDDGLSCPGNVELAVEQDSEMTMCFEIVNSGDSLLTGFEVRDPVLDIETDDLIAVFGATDVTLEPGQSIVLAAEVIVERNLRTQTQVTAVPVDEEGNELSERPAASTVTMFVTAVDPGGVPTFAEGLEESWELLVRLAQVLVLVLGALIPFFWVPLVVWLVWRARRAPEPAVETSTPE